jgi:membrane-associated phospholipid phosphatase
VLGLWVLAAVGAAAVLAATGAGARLPEAGHWLGHAVLFGLPPAVLAARGVRPAAAVGVGLGAGAAVELAQMLGSGRWLGGEAAFDLALDAVVAMAGALATGGPRAARALGAWLHPGVVLAIVVVGRLREHPEAAGAALLAGATVLPAVAAWLGAVATGRADVDLVRPEARRLPFLLGAAAVPGLLWAGTVSGALSPARAVALGAATAGFVGATLLGAKPSGHVGAAVVAAGLLADVAPRGAWLLIGVAALLAVARVRAGVHTPAQVLGGAAITGLASLPG